MVIHPIILCGGSGTRLWPLSRKSYPKQFTKLIGEHSLFQQTATRFDRRKFEAPIIVTNNEFRFIVAEQLAAVERQAAQILIEPEARNTAPAILAAALTLADHPSDLILVAPSDHLIAQSDAFEAAVFMGCAEAEKGRIVTFGITPDRPETGYGYLELSEPAQDNQAQHLIRFVEKPDHETALTMLESKRYLWNAGIFLFSVETILEAYKTLAPQLYQAVEVALQTAEQDLAFTRLEETAFSKAPSISIDYAIMEKSDALSVLPYGAGWSDLGSWDTVWRETALTEAGVATIGQVTAIECSDSYLHSVDEGVELVGIGLDDMIVVALKDAVLAAPKSRAQEVKKAVDALKEKGVDQAEQTSRHYRPWGWYETLSLGARYQVKRITVYPGGILSLQSHVHRAEHWVVVVGTAKVTLGHEEKILTENQSVYIPLGELHRLENPGKLPLQLIEVQTGSYLGEDDIKRYDDIYKRN